MLTSTGLASINLLFVKRNLGDLMKNLFLVDGAAGTGKTDMLSYLDEKYSSGNVAVIHKYTTREHRPEEVKRSLSLDLKFVTPRQFSNLQRQAGFYSYAYGSGLYGFHRSTIDSALKSYSNVFIIVRDRATIQQLETDYSDICTTPVFIYTDREQCEKRLLDDGYTKEAVQFRLDRQELAWNDYLKHSGLYREVIINNSNRTDFHRLIDALLQRYSPENEPSDMLFISNCERFPLLRPLIGFKKAIHSKSTDYAKNVFMMMKFRKENELVFGFIKKQIEDNGFNCIRADQTGWNITQNVYNPFAVLYCCKYGIALFDEAEDGNVFSANVAYELSMMQLQGKDCLILRHNSLPEMPFDLVKDVHQGYSHALELEGIVRRWLLGFR